MHYDKNQHTYSHFKVHPHNNLIFSSNVSSSHTSLSSSLLSSFSHTREAPSFNSLSLIFPHFLNEYISSLHYNVGEGRTNNEKSICSSSNSCLSFSSLSSKLLTSSSLISPLLSNSTSSLICLFPYLPDSPSLVRNNVEESSSSSFSHQHPLNCYFNMYQTISLLNFSSSSHSSKVSHPEYNFSSFSSPSVASYSNIYAGCSELFENERIKGKKFVKTKSRYVNSNKDSNCYYNNNEEGISNLYGNELKDKVLLQQCNDNNCYDIQRKKKQKIAKIKAENNVVCEEMKPKNKSYIKENNSNTYDQNSRTFDHRMNLYDNIEDKRRKKKEEINNLLNKMTDYVKIQDRDFISSEDKFKVMYAMLYIENNNNLLDKQIFKNKRKRDCFYDNLRKKLKLKCTTHAISRARLPKNKKGGLVLLGGRLLGCKYFDEEKLRKLIFDLYSNASFTFGNASSISPASYSSLDTSSLLSSLCSSSLSVSCSISTSSLCSSPSVYASPFPAISIPMEEIESIIKECKAIKEEVRRKKLKRYKLYEDKILLNIDLAKKRYALGLLISKSGSTESVHTLKLEKILNCTEELIVHIFRKTSYEDIIEEKNVLENILDEETKNEILIELSNRFLNILKEEKERKKLMNDIKLFNNNKQFDTNEEANSNDERIYEENNSNKSNDHLFITNLLQNKNSYDSLNDKPSNKSDCIDKEKPSNSVENQANFFIKDEQIFKNKEDKTNVKERENKMYIEKEKKFNEEEYNNNNNNNNNNNSDNNNNNNKLSKNMKNIPKVTGKKNINAVYDHLLSEENENDIENNKFYASHILDNKVKNVLRHPSHNACMSSSLPSCLYSHDYYVTERCNDNRNNNCNDRNFFHLYNGRHEKIEKSKNNHLNKNGIKSELEEENKTSEYTKIYSNDGTCYYFDLLKKHLKNKNEEGNCENFYDDVTSSGQYAHSINNSYFNIDNGFLIPSYSNKENTCHDFYLSKHSNNDVTYYNKNSKNSSPDKYTNCVKACDSDNNNNDYYEDKKVNAESTETHYCCVDNNNNNNDDNKYINEFNDENSDNTNTDYYAKKEEYKDKSSNNNISAYCYTSLSASLKNIKKLPRPFCLSNELKGKDKAKEKENEQVQDEKKKKIEKSKRKNKLLFFTNEITETYENDNGKVQAKAHDINHCNDDDYNTNYKMTVKDFSVCDTEETRNNNKSTKRSNNNNNNNNDEKSEFRDNSYINYHNSDVECIKSKVSSLCSFSSSSSCATVGSCLSPTVTNASTFSGSSFSSCLFGSSCCVLLTASSASTPTAISSISSFSKKASVDNFDELVSLFHSDEEPGNDVLRNEYTEEKDKKQEKPNANGFLAENSIASSADDPESELQENILHNKKSSNCVNFKKISKGSKPNDFLWHSSLSPYFHYLNCNNDHESFDNDLYHHNNNNNNNKSNQERKNSINFLTYQALNYHSDDEIMPHFVNQMNEVKNTTNQQHNNNNKNYLREDYLQPKRYVDNHYLASYRKFFNKNNGKSYYGYCEEIEDDQLLQKFKKCIKKGVKDDKGKKNS